MKLLKTLKVGECFKFNPFTIVFIRVRGGYRRGTGGPIGKINHAWLVIPCDTVGNAK
jgi:hypothetical protein